MRTTPSTCNRKRRYASQAAALTAAAAAPFRLNPYRCALCRNYHLTSRTKGMFVGHRPATRSTENPVLQPCARAMTDLPVKAGSGGN